MIIQPIRICIIYGLYYGRAMKKPFVHMYEWIKDDGTHKHSSLFIALLLFS